MKMIESLHNHTTASDGNLSHLEFFEFAEMLGVSVIAFTDHDSVPSRAVMSELETLRERNTKWIVGIEMTTDLPHELLPESHALHIIGLFVDPQNKALLEHCKLAQESRVKRMKQIVIGLQNLGFKIKADDCFSVAGRDAVGRPHIVEALKKYTENNNIIEKIRLEMKKEAEKDPEIKERYEQMIKRGEQQYPFVLFLADDAFRSVYIEHDYMPDLDSGVSIIREAGGVALLAHYCNFRKKISVDFLEKLLKEKRIDGVETIYGLREYENGDKIALDNERQTLRDLAQKYDAIVSGGSDAHKKADLEFYIQNDWYSNESIGFVENIISKNKVNKKFSSLD